MTILLPGISKPWASIHVLIPVHEKIEISFFVQLNRQAWFAFE